MPASEAERSRRRRARQKEMLAKYKDQIEAGDFDDIPVEDYVVIKSYLKARKRGIEYVRKKRAEEKKLIKVEPPDENSELRVKPSFGWRTPANQKLLTKYEQFLESPDLMKKFIPPADQLKVRRILAAKRKEMRNPVISGRVRQRAKRERDRELLRKYEVDDSNFESLRDSIPVADVRKIERILKQVKKNREGVRRRRVQAKELKEKSIVEDFQESALYLPADYPGLKFLVEQFKEMVKVSDDGQIRWKKSEKSFNLFRTYLAKQLETRMATVYYEEMEEEAGVEKEEEQYDQIYEEEVVEIWPSTKEEKELEIDSGPPPRVEPSKEYFTCDLCQRTFHTKTGIRQHILHDELNLRPFICNIPGCYRSFPRRATYLDHLQIHSGRLFYCAHCDGSFKTKTGLRDHLLRDEFPSQQFECHFSSCGRLFHKASLLKRHQATIHGIGVEKPKRVIQKSCCELCGKSVIKWRYQDHLNAHWGVKPYSCEICAKTFSSSHRLRDHRIVVHQKKFECGICAQQFENKRKLQAHSRQEHAVDLKPEATFPCSMCEGAYTTRKLLRAHMKRHTAEGPFYPCETCEKVFRDKQKLAQHAVKHTGAKNFACEICKKSFAHNSTLYNHKKAIHGQFGGPKAKLRTAVPDNLVIEEQIEDFMVGVEK